MAPTRPRSRLGVLLLSLLLAPPAVAGARGEALQDAAASRPDQVLVRQRQGGTAPVTGRIVESTLTSVVVETGGDTKSFPTADVERIELGDVPPAFREAATYSERGDHENAAAKYRLAATAEGVRDVVAVEARLRAAEALLQHGAVDPGAFASAAEEAAQVVAAHPTSREVPRARMLQARATLLAGDPADAAELYRSLYREAEGQSPTEGYDVALCLLAGLRGAHSYLAAGDTLHAQELFGSLESAAVRALSMLGDGDPRRPRVEAVRAQARLGEGWRLLAAGNASQAKSFFRGQLGANGGTVPPATRFGAHLGLAEALQAEGDHRGAVIEFATVSALDHVDRDRVAQALVGLAESTLALGDPKARSRARTWLETVIEQYGDTPAVVQAQSMLATL